jgi:hypothetical protein
LTVVKERAGSSALKKYILIVNPPNRRKGGADAERPAIV